MGRTGPAPLFGLAPGGVCRASLSPGCWWALTLRDRSPPAFSPLPRGTHRSARRYAFCCTIPILPGRCRVGRWALPTTASCGARTFLSLAHPRDRRSGNVARQAATARPTRRPCSYYMTYHTCQGFPVATSTELPLKEACQCSVTAQSWDRLMSGCSGHRRFSSASRCRAGFR